METYALDEIEELLPGVWDPTLVLNRVDPHAPDPDMPRATPNPAEGFTKVVELADIRRAWRLAPLALEQRRALFAVFGLHETTRGAEQLLGVDHTTVTRHKIAGLKVLYRFLNGREAIAA